MQQTLCILKTLSHFQCHKELTACKSAESNLFVKRATHLQAVVCCLCYGNFSSSYKQYKGLDHCLQFLIFETCVRSYKRVTSVMSLYDVIFTHITLVYAVCFPSRD